MKAAFFHYHLRPGGVTTVIKHQLAALQGVCECLVITGSLQPGAADVGAPTVVVPAAAYDNELDRLVTAQMIADGIYNAVHAHWPGGCDVLHVHNPTLMKNRRMPAALKILRDRGIKLFLQIHDFAEDGRPDAYYPEDYLCGVHYGVINDRDYRLMLQAGLEPGALHKIANQVLPLQAAPSDAHGTTGNAGGNAGNGRLAEKGLILYPVRAIRRKNIGEVLLLSLFLKEGQEIGITLPPKGGADVKAYNYWKIFLAEHSFPVRLEIAARREFLQLSAEAPCFITTSVNEGFGFAFLEPWTAGKMVYGRYLEQVCADFCNKGVSLDHLYKQLYVPLDLIDQPVPMFSTGGPPSFYHRWSNGLAYHARRLAYPLDPDRINSAYEHLTAGGVIDFGILDEEAQMSVLLALLTEKTSGGVRLRQHLLELNPALVFDADAPGNADIIRHNDQTVRRAYGNDYYRRRLLEIYAAIITNPAGITNPVGGGINKQVLTAAFLKPEDFKMLRWQEPIN